MAVTMLWNVTGVFILTVCHPEQRLETLIFEQVSAFGTVGLSMEFTPLLNAPARLWIIVSMFIGRLGPLSIALWVVPSARVNIHRPEGRLMVG
jgi:trk system potassium uptake protein TrkH